MGKIYLSGQAFKTFNFKWIVGVNDIRPQF